MRDKLPATCFLVCVLALVAEAEVTTFQNGVSPTKAYKGCVDTCLEGYGKTRPQNKSAIFWTPGPATPIKSSPIPLGEPDSENASSPCASAAGVLVDTERGILIVFAIRNIRHQ